MPIDYKRYPKNWKTEIVPRIKERDGYRCKFCGVEEHFVRESGAKVVLTVAHLDHDAENHNVSDDRLASLCQRCHLAYDADFHKKNARKTRERRRGFVSLFPE